MAKPPSQSRSSGRDRNETGDSNQALLRSAYAADSKGVIAALEAGADVDAADAVTGLTALHIAVGTNNLHLTRILVEDWEAQFQPDGKGRWPSLIAAEAAVDAALADYIVEAEAQAQP
jgi:ankyrin repeat protein